MRVNPNEARGTPAMWQGWLWWGEVVSQAINPPGPFLVALMANPVHFVYKVAL